MTTIISTKTSGVGGLSVTGDASGILQLASADGTTALTINASQNVGIGTSSPSKKLSINGDFRLGDGGGTGAIFTDATNGLRFMLPAAGTSNTESMRIDSSGNVGIGTSSPVNKLTVSATTATQSIVSTTTGNAAYLVLQNSADSSNAYVYATGKELRLSQADTSASSIVTINTQNTERMRIDSSGNVGIGTSSPAYKLHVVSSADRPLVVTAGTDTPAVFQSTTANSYIQLKGTGQDVYFGNVGGAATITAGTERMRIDSSGNVGIGTSTINTVKLQVTGASSRGTALFQHPGDNSFGTILTLETTGGTDDPAISFKNYNGGSPTYYSISGTDNGSIAFNAGGYTSSFGTERMRIDSSGYLLVGTTSYVNSITANTFYTVASQNTVHIVGTIAANVAPLRIQRAASDGDGLTFFYGTAQKGYISVLSTGTTYNSISDYRLKENVVPMVGALDRVMQLNPVSYVWKDNQKADEGFIAHEVKNIVPSAVSGEKDELDDEGNPRYQGLDQSRIVSVLTAAIQELKAIIDTQNARIEALEVKQWPLQ